MPKACPNCRNHSWKVCPKCGGFVCYSCKLNRDGKKMKSNFIKTNTCLYQICLVLILARELS